MLSYSLIFFILKYTKLLPMNTFQYKEDYIFFLNELAKGDEDLFTKKYLKLFDFRDTSVKRKEFNRIRNDVYKKLVLKFGEKCNCQSLILLNH